MKVEDIEKNNKSSQREEYKGTALFDDERIGKTLQTLQEYKRGKASIDEKATANHEWWRLRHWNVIQGETNVGTDDGKSVGSAWTVNSILNKHADIMDSYPKPNVLPREADDEEEAEMLTRILPVIEEQNEAEEVYDAVGYDFLIDGTAVTGVFWDNTKHDGMGDILKTNVDIHNVFWQPGITDIQDSEMFFHVAIDKADSVKTMYPELEKDIGAYDSGLVSRYIHDDTIDTTNDVEIIDCYYKKVVMKPVVMNSAKGSVVIHQIPSTQVHLAKIICGKCVFCSEGMEGYEEGFYNHGKYPFVFRRLFPIKDSPCGFGYLDIMKNPQKDIDKLDQAILRNTLQIAKKRWWVKKNADIDRKAFADWDEELVEVGTGDLGNAVMEMRVDSLPGIVENYRQYKIEELKETSGNRDFSQGSTQSGVTAASAIAALQEAGSKLSRDVNKSLYRGSRLEYELEIELIRQFYTEDRSFRIDNGEGGYEFATYSNKNLVAQDVQNPDGTTRHKRSIFDISISAEKNSPFSRAAQNETAKEMYQLGFFTPGNELASLVCIDMMEFEGKEKIKQAIQENGTIMQQYQQMANLIVQTMPQMAAQIGLISPEEAVAGANAVMPSATEGEQILGKGTAEERAARKTAEGGRENTRMENARKRAREGASI